MSRRATWAAAREPAANLARSASCCSSQRGPRDPCAGFYPRPGGDVGLLTRGAAGKASPGWPRLTCQGVLRIFCFWASNSACVRAPLSSSSLSWAS